MTMRCGGHWVRKGQSVPTLRAMAEHGRHDQAERATRVERPRPCDHATGDDGEPLPSMKKIMSMTFARLYVREVGAPVSKSSVGTR